MLARVRCDGRHITDALRTSLTGVDEEVGPLLIEHILHTKGTEVATIGPGARVADAVALLRERNVGALVVTDPDDGHVIGILSERDVVRALAAETTAGDTLQAPVSDLMSTDLATCTAGETVNELARVMTDRRIRHLPVLDGDRLAGIVSIGDIVKSRIDELETETETLHEYLSSGR